MAGVGKEAGSTHVCGLGFPDVDRRPGAKEALWAKVFTGREEDMEFR